MDYMRAGADVRTYTDHGIFIPCRNTCTFTCQPGQQVSIINFNARKLHDLGLVYPLSDFTNWWQGTSTNASEQSLRLRREGEYLVLNFLSHPNPKLYWKLPAATENGNEKYLRGCIELKWQRKGGSLAISSANKHPIWSPERPEAKHEGPGNRSNPYQVPVAKSNMVPVKAPTTKILYCSCSSRMRKSTEIGQLKSSYDYRTLSSRK